MKTNPRTASIHRLTALPALFLAACLVCNATLSAATFSINPPVVSNDYSGALTLVAAGLANSESVQVDVFIDANANGIVDAADFLVQSFPLTDGGVTTIGGVTNSNIPGDLDPASGSITASLNFRSLGLAQKTIGQYVYRLSSPTSRFTPIPTPFKVTNSAYSQSITGTVLGNGLTLPNAGVLLFAPDPNGEGLGTPIGGVVANNLGVYTIKAPPGVYILWAFKSNYVANLASPQIVTLGSGAAINMNINLLPASRTIAGKVTDASSPVLGLPGIMTVWKSSQGLIAVGFTDGAGNFTVPVTQGRWKLGGGDSEALRLRGYLGLEDGAQADTSNGNVAGVSIALPKATALFYGNVKDDLNKPIVGAYVHGYSENIQGSFQTDALTDQNGYYVLAVVAGIWNADVDAEYSGYANYMFSSGLGGTAIANGQAVRRDFTAKLAANLITGTVKDNMNQPLGGVDVYASARMIDGTLFNKSSRTDANGGYSLNVGNGEWHVKVNCSDGESSLSSKGHQCVDDQTVIISNNNGVAHFTPQLCGPLQVTTTALSDGQVGSSYFFKLQVSGCNQPFTWSFVSGAGSPPPGLNLSSDGTLSGNPSTGGTFNFSVRVTDGTSTSATKSLSLTIVATLPLRVETAGLYNATAGVFYDAQLGAYGGQPPYVWSLVLGSGNLPQGLNLSSDGRILGNPSMTGAFNFSVRVTDGASTSATQSLSLTVMTVPLQMTTRSLPDATAGVSYSAQLLASGGQPPYVWSLLLGSANLPAGLNLASDGSITGTPGADGNFSFIAGVTDAASASASRALTLKVNPAEVPIRFQSLFRSGTTTTLTWNAVVGRSYEVQFKNNLNESSWNNWIRVTANNSTATVSDFDAITISAQRFYRLLIIPSIP